MFNLKQFFMQKKNLFGIALLCASVFLFTGCKEIMSHFDNAVDSHLQVADKVTVIGVGGTYQIAKDVDYKTISDADPSFESLDKAIATVEPKTGVVKALKSGDARIKISLPDNGLYLDASAVINVKVRVETFEQLVDEVKNASTEEKTSIYLAKDATIDMTSNLKLEGKDVAIIGENTTIKSKSSFLVSKSFTVENVKFDLDASAAKQFIMLSPAENTPKNDEIYTDAGKKDLYLCENITIKNVIIKDLANSLVYMNKKNWALVNLNIENSIVQFNFSNSKSIIDFKTGEQDSYAKTDPKYSTTTNMGSIKNISIINNTFYNVQANSSGYFLRFASADASQCFGTKNGTSTYDYNMSNNTFIRTMTGKDFANQMNNSKKLKNTFKNNIFYDVYRIYQYVNSNHQLDVSGNYIFYGVTAKQNNDLNYATELTTAPFTAPTEALDLTKEKGGWNLKPTGNAAAAGDPRWTK